LHIKSQRIYKFKKLLTVFYKPRQCVLLQLSPVQSKVFTGTGIKAMT